jgi:nucleoside 2-deoxyribosyltransferase
MHGCDFGIAIFDEVEEHTFNPNIAFETGYMFGLEKPVLLLKDRRLRTLPSDLLGLLYKEFDPDNVRDTVPQKIREFAEEKNLI